MRYEAIVNVIDESRLRKIDGGIVALINKHSGMPLEVRPSEYKSDFGHGPGNMAQIQQGLLRPRGFIWQEWLMLPVKHKDEAVYCFFNLSSMKVLDIDGVNIDKNGAKCSQWKYGGPKSDNHQHFRKVQDGAEYFKLMNMESGKPLCVDYNTITTNVTGGLPR